MPFYLKYEHIDLDGNALDLPQWQYSEIDDDLLAKRTIEIFRNGNIGWTKRASGQEHGGAYLPEGTYPSQLDLQKTNCQLPDFPHQIISKIEFENKWDEALLRNQQREG